MKKILTIILLMVSFTAYSQVTLRKGYIATQNGDTLELAYSNGIWTLDSDTTFKIILDTVYFSDGTYQTTSIAPPVDSSWAKIVVGSGGDTLVIDTDGTVKQYNNGALVLSTNNKGWISQDYVHFGYRDVVLGYEAYNSWTGGYNNTVIGERAYYLGATGNDNVAVGRQALYSTNGVGNIAVGNNSLYSTTSGNYSTSLGHYSGQGNTTGEYNVFLGRRAGLTNAAESNNICLGANAGANNSTLSNRLFVNSFNRSNLNNDTTESIIYGVQDAVRANQKLYINAHAYIDTATIEKTKTNTINIESVEIYADSDTLKAPTFWAMFKGFLGDIFTAQKITTDTLVIGDSTITDVITLKEAVEAESFDIIDVDTLDGYIVVTGRIITEHYEAAAYVPEDSTLTTSATTSWIFVGSGSNNKFVNIEADGFTFDGDTLMFEQDVTDLRDSIEFHIDWSTTSSASNNGITCYYGIFIKSDGESVYTEYEPATKWTRLATSGQGYAWACTRMPVWLKDDDKIQIRVRASGSTTITTDSFGVYITEE